MKKLLYILLLVLMTCTTVQATNYYVSMQYGSQTNNGLSWATAKSNLYATLTNSFLGDIVNVGAGTYTNVNASTPWGGWGCKFYLNEGVTLIGTNGGEVILDGQNASRCLMMNTNSVATNIIFRRGNGGSGSYGGNVYAFGNARIYNCKLWDCYAGNSFQGGKIFNSEIYSNNVNGCGVKYATASNCVIAYNLGLGVQESLLYNSSIVSNSGKGVNISTNIACLIGWNKGSGGGAGCYQCVSYSSVIIYNTNTSANTGAGVYLGTAYNCLILFNNASNYTSGGGGVYGASVTNSVIYGNSAKGATTFNASNFYNSIVPAGIWTNPVTFLEGSWKLPASSPLIDAGNDTFVSAGYPDYYGRLWNGIRIYGLHVDYGASEWNPDDIPVSDITGGAKYRALDSWFIQKGY